MVAPLSIVVKDSGKTAQVFWQKAQSLPYYLCPASLGEKQRRTSFRCDLTKATVVYFKLRIDNLFAWELRDHTWGLQDAARTAILLANVYDAR